MRFVWFWTFWHWSKESYRSGSLLRSPLHGIGSHWDEWFRHEASENDRQAIEESGRTEPTQRQFIAWLFRHWAREMDWRGNRMVPRFVIDQLAHLPPFSQWPAFEKYRTSYGVVGISALVLAEKSLGEPEDVRAVEAMALPADSAGQAVMPEGFRAEAAEFDAPRLAAKSLLCGKGLLIFLALWITGGRRPYARWLSIALFLGWGAVLGLILFLLAGPEPGNQLFLFSAVLVALWSGLMLAAAVVVARQSFRAWRTGAELSARLEHSQVRLRMNGGLTLKGGSAGLPFCLNTLLALYYARPEAARRSWIWHRFFHKMRSEAESWAGTGVITGDGYLTPVVIEPKLRACLKHDRIRQILTPRQRDASQQTVDHLAETLTVAVEREAKSSHLGMQLGFAAEKPRLRAHGCRHVAHTMMALGGFADKWQMASRVFALVVSAIMLMALADLRSIVLPHPAPIAVTPGSSSPYYLWVSLDTKHPKYFSVVLESDYWSNRRADVKPCGGVTSSVRAVILLHRLTGMTAANEEDGVVWIERRRRFLTREFHPGERVGRYSIPYLSRLGHE